MTSLFRRFTWWLQRRRKENELREELQFHLANEADERQADGLTEDQARWAVRRDPGNVTLLREWQSRPSVPRRGEYVSGDFFRGLAVAPAAGRLICSASGNRRNSVAAIYDCVNA
jgi:hypothetical protein